jgi:hypothetical protein
LIGARRSNPQTPRNTNPAYAGVIRMQSPGLTGSLHLDDVEIAGSLSQGVYINGPVVDAQTMHDRGVPYHVGTASDHWGKQAVSAGQGLA